MTSGTNPVGRLRSFCRSCRPPVVVALVMAVLIGIAVTLTVDRSLERSLERSHLERLADEAGLLVDEIEGVLGEIETRLIAIAGLFRASERVDRHEFAQFASDLGLLNGMGGYGFAPLVSHHAITAWEDAVAAEVPGYRVYGIDGAGQRTPPPSVAYHTPLTMFWPEEAFGIPPLGLDLMSEPMRARTIEASLRRGRTTLTPFLVLLGMEDDDGFIAIHPVVAPNGTTVMGYLTAPIDLSLLLDTALPASLRKTLVWRVTDLTAGHTLEPPQPPVGPRWTETITFGDRSWAIEVARHTDASRLETLQHAQVIVPGILASLLAGLVVLLVAGTLDERRRRVGLEAVIEAKERFLATVSHELRTPLTGVVGFLDEVLSGHEADPDKRRAMVALAASEAHAMSDIIDDLITATGTRDSGTPANLRSVELTHEIRAVLTSFEQEVAVEDGDAEAWVWADPARVRQILRNLLGNAARFGRPPYRIGIVRTPQSVAVTVSDDGDGIDPDQRHLLFRPYQPLDPATTQPPSLGLGLWLSRLLATRMRGDLRYHPDPHPTFTLTLPATPGTPAAE